MTKEDLPILLNRMTAKSDDNVSHYEGDTDSDGNKSHQRSEHPRVEPVQKYKHHCFKTPDNSGICVPAWEGVFSKGRGKVGLRKVSPIQHVVYAPPSHSFHLAFEKLLCSLPVGNE